MIKDSYWATINLDVDLELSDIYIYFFFLVLDVILQESRFK